MKISDLFYDCINFTTALTNEDDLWCMHFGRFESQIRVNFDGFHTFIESRPVELQAVFILMIYRSFQTIMKALLAVLLGDGLPAFDNSELKYITKRASSLVNTIDLSFSDKFS